ncbi:alpha/beta fold hydrolase [Streptosporangium saharense]|uniref:Pimeloyl-ACP methyl ester carboxylesterase n=1 Tax=Streptosporangium saharense TaxID=1706840 RepID=A0A7W7VLW0_9ACTN|nr:alpha/beta hydrolase [Streptosporangium saharense]MBB4914834.1 pimeloyl-ACP methyl ester carboxylesterase [Streptosporangium saharense]
MRTFRRVLAALALGTTMVAAPQTSGQTLRWAECGDGMQCADLTVPIDWKRPDGQKTRVNLARMPARDPSRSLGPLVVNTGGGGATIQDVRSMPAVVSELTTWFDVILVNARSAVSRSDNAIVECARRPPDLTGLILRPGEKSWRAHARANAAYDASCRTAMGTAYAGLTSWQVAHDLEAVRSALGERRLRYLGNSYGTVHGQAYLELFPDRVGRMVLDGVADHTWTSLERWLLDNALTEERQFSRFRDWCAAGCALGGDDAIEVFDDLLARARRTPLPAGNRTVNEREFLVAVREGLTPPAWPRLASALREAADGDATALARLLPPAAEGPGYPHRALMCHDFMPQVPDYLDFLAVESRLRAAAPRIGWIQGRYQVARCLGVRADPSYPPHPPRVRNVPPVLVSIGDTDDNTPNLAAEHMAAQLPGARVVRHGDGHAAYLMQGASGLDTTCLRRYVHDYLTTGTLPPSEARCPGDLIARIPRS